MSKTQEKEKSPLLNLMKKDHAKEVEILGDQTINVDPEDVEEIRVNIKEKKTEKRPEKSEDDSEITVKRTGSIFNAILNLVNGLIGAGVLGFPFANYRIGLVTGIAVELYIVILNSISVAIVVQCSFLKGGLRSYQNLIEIYLGKFWKKVAEFITFFMATGICMVYIVIISQFIKPILDLFASETFFSYNIMIMLFFGCIIVFPLILLREIKNLSFTSFIANVGSVYLCCFIVGYGIYSIVVNGFPIQDVRKIFWIQTDMYLGVYPFIFLGIPMKFFGYVCQALVVPVAYELKNGNATKMNFVQIVSMVITYAIYTLVGLFGFFAFGSDIEDNILNNFSGINVFADIARFLCGLNIIFSVPILFYLGRLVIVTFFWGKDKELKTSTFLIISIAYFFFVLIVSLLIPVLSVLFGLVGAVAGSTLMLFFQSLLSWKVLAKKYHAYKYFFYGLSILLFVSWLFFCVTGTIASVFRVIETLKL